MKTKHNISITVKGHKVNVKVTETEYRGQSYFNCGVAETASVIRQLIKAQFKSVGKFWVTSDSYAGGDSVRVSLNNVAIELRNEIEAYISIFSAGRFNGMEDIYEYDSKGEKVSVEHNGRTFTMDTKYLFVENTPKYGTPEHDAYYASKEANSESQYVVVDAFQMASVSAEMKGAK